MIEIIFSLIILFLVVLLTTYQVYDFRKSRLNWIENWKDSAQTTRNLKYYDLEANCLFNVLRLYNKVHATQEQYDELSEQIAACLNKMNDINCGFNRTIDDIKEYQTSMKDAKNKIDRDRLQGLFNQVLKRSTLRSDD